MLILASAEGVAAITVAAALGVAFITAITTNRRQREALKHDRELFDLADLRKLLDEATLLIHDAGDALAALEVRFNEHGKALAEDEREKVEKAGRRLDEASARMYVRMPEDARLTTTLQACVDAVHDGWRSLRRLEDAESVAARRADLEAAQTALGESGGAFIQAAHERAGTVEMRGSE